MRRLRFLTSRHRAPSTNRALGTLLAFNAGAVNAGGFLVVHMYTSHMTGFASQLADAAVLGDTTLVLNALGAIVSFLSGASVTAVLVNWGRQRRRCSVYALPLLLEALLLFSFGFAGAATLRWPTPFALPSTVMLLAFIMGVQNAVASKTSGGSIRTTHMTGNITDLGMELGKMLYRSGAGSGHGDSAVVEHGRRRLRLALALVGAFVLGGATGALGFEHIGFAWVVPFAVVLLALSIPPLLEDMRRVRRPVRA